MEDKGFLVWRELDFRIRVHYLSTRNTSRGYSKPHTFLLTVNPLSYLLQKKEGYKLGTDFERRSLSHLFVVDDLKLFVMTPEK